MYVNQQRDDHRSISKYVASRHDFSPSHSSQTGSRARYTMCSVGVSAFLRWPERQSDH
jgi:hypothetical protein